VTKSQRLALERSVRRVTGLELWLIGEAEYSQTELEDMVLFMTARIAAIRAIVLHGDEDTDPEGEPPWKEKE